MQKDSKNKTLETQIDRLVKCSECQTTKNNMT